MGRLIHKIKNPMNNKVKHQSINQSLYVQTENDKITVNGASIPYNTSANNRGKRINLSFSQENDISRECIYAISISELYFGNISREKYTYKLHDFGNLDFKI
jgi:hypothetical protein